uniref:Uncharacterized protein n=1 Tax=Panagrolaimus sp. PS1159 TaxID=55785 RepID=A0AC35FXS2_9BILA
MFKWKSWKLKMVCFIDENFSPNDFKTSNPSTSTSTSSIPNSPRSKSAPPKQQKQELKTQTKNGKHLKIDEEGSNSHELSLFFCSPTVSNSFDMSMDLMNTSEMNNDNFNDVDDYADGEEGEEEEEEIKNDNVYVNLSGPSSFSHLSNSEMKKTVVAPSSSKPVNIFTFETESDVANIESKNNNNILENNIQSRPLPPIPNTADEDQIPEEPEDSAPEFEIPEPEYACVDGDIGYETIHHQRSISDHVLSYNQIDEKMKTIDFLKKSNSDRSERRSTRKKPTQHLSEQLQSSEEDEHRKLSDISEHRKTYSCSTPSFLLQPSIDINEGGGNDDEIDDGRKRSITTDSISSPPPKQPLMPKTLPKM